MSSYNAKLAPLLQEVIRSQSACEQLNAVLLEIAARRDPKIHSFLVGQKKLTNPPPAPPRFIDDEKNIMIYIERNKNQNVVVYKGILADASSGKTLGGASAEEEAAVVAAGTRLKLDEKAPLDPYWLDVDPAYMEANRKKKIMTNRQDLNMIEKKMAYGCSVDTSKPLEDIHDLLVKGRQQPSAGLVAPACPIADPKILPAKFVAVKHHIFYEALVTVPVGQTVVYLPIAFGLLSGKLCILEKIYVQAKEGGMLSLPTVQHVDLFGWVVPSGASGDAITTCVPVTERIIP